MKSEISFLILFSLISLAQSFNCSTTSQEYYCSQMPGCTFKDSKCTGSFSPTCSYDECLYVYPDTEEEEEDGSAKHPFADYSAALGTSKPGKTIAIFGFNLPEEEFVFGMGGYVEEDTAFIIEPFFNESQQLTVKGQMNFFKAVSFMNTDILFNGIVSAQITSNAVMNISNSEITYKDFEGFVETEENEDFSLQSFKCYEGGNFNMANINIQYTSKDGFVATQKDCQIHVQNLTWNQQISGDSAIIFYINGSTFQLYDSTFQGSHDLSNFNDNLIIGAIDSNVDIKNVQFKDTNKHLIQSSQCQSLVITDTIFENLLDKNAIQINQAAISGNYQIKNVTFRNCAASQSLIILKETRIEFEELSFENTSQISNNSPIQGLCMLASQSLVVVNQSNFINTNGQCLAFFTTYPLVNQSTFDNSDILSYIDSPQDLMVGQNTPFIYFSQFLNIPLSLTSTNFITSSSLISGCHFEENMLLPSYGGAIYATQYYDYTFPIVIQKSTFHNMRANEGGSVYLYMNDVEASIYGGVSLQNNSFNNSTSVSEGGAVVILVENSKAFTIDVTNNTFENCSAGAYGGGLVIEGLGGNFLVTHKKEEDNYQVYSPQNQIYEDGFEAILVNSIEIFGNNFTKCNADAFAGGALISGINIPYISNNTEDCYFANNSFFNNSAYHGGGLVLLNTTTDVNTSNHFYYNEAEQYGAAYINLGNGDVCKNCPNMSTNIAKDNRTFINHVISDYQIELYQLIANQNLLNVFNLSVLTSDSRYTSLNSTYNTSTIKDLHLQQIPGHPLPYIFKINPIDQNGDPIDFINYQASIQYSKYSGGTFPPYQQTLSTIQTVNTTLYVYDQIRLVGEATQEATICIEATSGSSILDLDQNSPQFCFNITFGKCSVGDIFQNATGSCQTCPNGTFSFDDPYSIYAMCQPCPSHLTCYGGAVVIPNEGYYRLDVNSSIAVQCLNEDACLGGRKNQDNFTLSPEGYCNGEFEGSLCSQCKDGYTPYSDHSGCEECMIDFVFVFSVILKYLLSFGIILFELRRSFNKSRQLLEAYENEQEEELKGVMARFDASAVYRTVVTFFQIIFILKSANFGWNIEYLSFLSYFTFTKSTDKVYCILYKFGVTDREDIILYEYIAANLQPFSIILLLAIFYAILCYFRRKRNHHDQFSYKLKMINVTLVTLYLLQPELLVESFNLFSCVVLEGKSYLGEDLNIQCSSTTYKHTYYPVGLSMLAVWGILLPLILLSGIRSGFTKYKNLEEKYEALARYSFIVAGFKQQFYYWEFVRQAKKLFLIVIVLELSKYGLLSSSLLMIMMLYAFIMFNNEVNAYENEAVRSLDNLSLYSCILLIFWGVLSDQLNSEAYSQEQNKVIFYLLLGCIAILIVYFLLQAVLFFFNVYKGRISGKLKKIAGKFTRNKTKKQEDENSMEELQIETSNNEVPLIK